MKRAEKKASNKLAGIMIALAAVVVIVAGFIFFNPFGGGKSSSTAKKTTSTSSTKQAAKYEPSQEEKDYLKNRFAQLTAVNPETIGYVYAPGTELDEPVVQTTDNETYLNKTFDGGNEPLMGTVFMDTDNKKDFSDRLTWLFGHARGSKVADHRMFNDVNFYDKQDYFDQHPYVVIETPDRKYYYEAMCLVIVPEDTAFYRTSFTDDKDFTTQLKKVYEDGQTKNPNIKIKASDKYLVLSTCREEDETIRANLYLRQIPDSEMKDFVAKHADQLKYVATRDQQ
ncbi:class B sortase, LPKTxAVK-specific [Streptococcus parasanguinis]|uniref:class B sortase, LPKTxAVK-specific n=1 Tax=Streptococcus TaxID=1301 RepID=UPI001BEA24C1|nr:class B sortase, LPKTxAVK-specific [Streptococcus parasanguinis]MBT3138680.1 class B sortase [Streptococcus parasanguinis]MCB6703021.1 class B sortase, LPKTxAVK-specific [Streptococcus parasanguinis]MCB6737800.1 class B sortase, LPKTxAVK-specific [Streptococcus parasanguinis]MCB7321843.1 class B sortase, LPKTxAVK-specific [Streptococcus parasanguinis]MCB7401662.1 class B sortase, LPKTxAVK-specific [Streptococcus parasanguinis]